MYRSILVPLDGSPLSERALPLACAIARSAGAALRLALVPVRATLHPVYVEGLPILDSELHPLARAHDLAYLQAIADRLRPTLGAPVTVAVLEQANPEQAGQSVPAILLRYVTGTDVDLIVMTTHGRGGASRFWLGSVAEVVTRASPVPILLLCPGDAPQPAAPAPIRQVLIPLDGSPLAEQILGPALALGALTGAELRLLHVVEPHGHDSYPRGEAEAWGYLEGVALRLERAGVRVRTRLAVAEHVAAAIMDEARQHEVDVIALATHGRSGLDRLVHGSVAGTVLRAAHQPVLMLRPRAAAPQIGPETELVAADTGPDHPGEVRGRAPGKPQ